MMLTLSLFPSPLPPPTFPPSPLSVSFSLSLSQQSKIIVLNPTLDDKGSVVAEEGTFSVCRSQPIVLSFSVYFSQQQSTISLFKTI